MTIDESDTNQRDVATSRAKLEAMAVQCESAAAIAKQMAQLIRTILEAGDAVIPNVDSSVLQFPWDKLGKSESRN